MFLLLTHLPDVQVTYCAAFLCISDAFTTHLIPRQELQILLPIWLIINDDKLDSGLSSIYDAYQTSSLCNTTLRYLSPFPSSLWSTS